MGLNHLSEILQQKNRGARPQTKGSFILKLLLLTTTLNYLMTLISNILLLLTQRY